MPAVTFNGVAIFGSGPQRAVEETRGSLVVPYIASGIEVAGSRALGLLEVGVRVSGRLVAGSAAGLHALIDGVASRITDPAGVGTLVDTRGRAYPGMSLVRVEWGERVESGAGVTLSYEARFVRFALPPGFVEPGPGDTAGGGGGGGGGGETQPGAVGAA